MRVTRPKSLTVSPILKSDAEWTGAMRAQPFLQEQAGASGGSLSRRRLIYRCHRCILIARRDSRLGQPYRSGSKCSPLCGDDEKHRTFAFELQLRLRRNLVWCWAKFVHLPDRKADPDEGVERAGDGTM